MEKTPEKMNLSNVSNKSLNNSSKSLTKDDNSSKEKKLLFYF